MLLRAGIPLLGLIGGCGDAPDRKPAPPSPLELGIARDLAARFRTSANVRCAVIAGTPLRCEAHLAEGTKLPITIIPRRGEWAWQVDGVVVETSSIIEHVRGALADLRADQPIDCGARVQLVAAGERMTCKLGGGGRAFFHVAADGQTSLELALDAASAAARGEPVTPAQDVELTAISKALEALEGESDGEEAVPADGGAGKP